MIGGGRRRPRVWPMLPGVAAALLLGTLLAARPPGGALADPAREGARRETVRSSAASAEAALAQLSAELEVARAFARQGAALVVEGDEPPGPTLEAGAESLEGARPEAAAAAHAVTRLNGILAAIEPGRSIPPPPAVADLAGIAAQLRDAAEASALFVERRHAARATLAHLEEALGALEADRPMDAHAAIADARASRDVVASWDPAPVTLGPWLETVGALIEAAGAVADAALAGDREAAERAAAQYAAAAEEANRADISLALSLSEAGGGLTATPLSRLADALADTEAAMAGVASLLQSPG